MKTELLMRKACGSLTPDGRESWEVFDKLPANKSVLVSVKTSRNPDHLRKYWAICAAVADADPEFDDREDADHWVRIQIPWMRREYVVKSLAGEQQLIVRPKSISMASMTQEEFSRFYDRALELWAEKIGMDPDDLGREANERRHR